MPELQEKPMRPERLLPTHIADRAFKAGADKGEEPFKSRSEALFRADSFEDVLRDEAERRGIEVSDDLNLSLIGIEEFQQYVKEAQSIRKIIKGISNPSEIVKATAVYNDRKGKIDEYLSFGPSFEAAYREYLRERNTFSRFELNRQRLNKLERALSTPSFASLSENSRLDEHDYSRIEHILRGESILPPEEQEERELQKEALKTIYAPGSKEYNDAIASLEQGWNAGGSGDVDNSEKVMELSKKLKEAEPGSSEAQRISSELESLQVSGVPTTKKEIMEEIDELKQEIAEAWENPMVRRFWQKKEMDRLLSDFSKGKDVLETQSVVKHLNQLYEWELEHQRTTVGADLVGPPGVGKTTLVRHYLEERKRPYVYLDLSEDVTRFMLYGTRSIEFKSTTEYHRALLSDLNNLDQKGFETFIRENAKIVQDVLELDEGQQDQALITALGSLPLDDEAFASVKEKIIGFAQKAFAKELGTEFSHLGKKNGWREGVVIAALKRGDSIIMDEFNKNKNWSLIYGLMTAKPGENWYFADNDENIKIPDNWRMYFTANIGTKHGTFAVAEALASRSEGKVMEVAYPPVAEEMMIALCSLSDAEGNFLRSQEDLAKLFVTVHELFPKTRTYIEDKKQIIPISFRTIRDLGEKLVMVHDPESKRPVYNATSKTFDEALYEVMIESYSLYEDKSIPREIVNLATTVGLLLDDSIKDKIVNDGNKGWIDEDIYNERKEAQEKNKEDFNEIVKKIRGLSHMAFDMPLPQGRTF